MRRAFDLCRRALARVNARLALLIVVVAIAGLAVWQGAGRLRKAPPLGPLKQVATGLPATAQDPAPSEPPPDAPSPPADGGAFLLASFGQHSAPPTSPPATPQPPTTPRSYIVEDTGGEASPSPPADPLWAMPPTQPPANPYRDVAAITEEYAAESPAPLPPDDPVATSGIAAPPNALPTTEPAIDPYPAAAGVRSLSGGGYGQTGSYPHPNPLPVGEGTGRPAADQPGERQLEGPQQPVVSIEKFSPAEIQIGKPAIFELLVRNVGQVAAHEVVVTDFVPAGTQLVAVKPQPQQGTGGALVWNLGTLQPGQEQPISLEVMPQQEGPIGSTAHVRFAAAATSRSICTRPQLAIEQTAPAKVLIGESLRVSITVYNPGTGPASGVVIEEDVPDGLSHAAGSELEYEIGTLRPLESKQLELSLRAEKPGLIQNTIRVQGEGNLAAQHTVQIEVVAPQLQVQVQGPRTRYLQRQATYTLQIANPGTAAARDVELIARLPRGMKFVTTDSQGQYDPAQHAVFWSLAELAPAQAGQVKLTTLPVEPGEQRLHVQGRAELGLSAESEQVVQVEQSAELLHTVKDLDEVIEVGSETMYEIRVTNSGTKAATNVRIAAQMPDGLAALEGIGPTRASGDATQVVFEPLGRLNPQEEVIYKIRVQATQPGDKIVRVQLASDEWPVPVTREESTRVYEDR